MRKNWVIIAAAGTFIATYSAMGSSVKTHHESDDKRDAANEAVIKEHSKDIAALKVAVDAIPRIERKQDNLIEVLLSQLPRSEQNKLRTMFKERARE